MDKPKADINKQKSVEKSDWWQPAVLMFARLSFWIAGPVILALIFGKWADDRFATTPWMLLATTGIAFIFSITMIVIEAAKEYGRINGKPLEMEKNPENPKKDGEKH